MNSVSVIPQPRRVKARFIGPFTVALLFILMVFALAFYWVGTHVRELELAERSAAVSNLFAQKLDKDTNLMMATMRAMMTNSAMETAFRQGDRAGIARQGGELFATLREEHRITHLYLTRPDYVNVYRFHSPDEYGDVITRVLLREARKNQRAIHGLELGAMGTLTLRLAVPWQRNGELIGYIEIGEEIEHLIDEIHDSLKVDLLVLVDKKHLSPERWTRGQIMMKRSGTWERFQTHAVLAQTAEQLPAALDEGRLKSLLAGATTEIKEAGRALHLATVPIHDVGGQHLGDLVMIRDITALVDAFHVSVVAVALISLLAATAVLYIFYLALDRVERDYRRQHDLEHQLLHLDTEHRRVLQVEKLSALGTMVGSIAHQLNNPLVGVVNLAQLAERGADDPVRTRELLRDIRSAGEDCRAFVKRMLAFTKVSGFESRPTAMGDLIEETVLLFRQTEKRHLPVDVQLPEEPVVLTVDPILIRHALFNLLVNAAQATETTSSESGAIMISLLPENDPGRGLAGWALAVSDHGRGMPPEVLEKIFVPFFTTRSDGTGLGLPVVQHVALLHGGQVTVQSEPGHGTRFAIWLPEASTNTA